MTMISFTSLKVGNSILYSFCDGEIVLTMVNKLSHYIYIYTFIYPFIYIHMSTQIKPS